MTPLTVRGYYKTSFQTYNLLTLRTLHTNKRHIPRYWQWYNYHHQQVLSECEGKRRLHQFSLMNVTKIFLKWLFLNHNISRLGPCWSLCWPKFFLPPYLVLVTSYVFCICTYPYVQSDDLLDIPALDTFWFIHAYSRSLTINILRFTPEPQILLSISPNQ